MTIEKPFDFQSIKTNSIKINYLYVCERKLWLFDRGIQMESRSDRFLEVRRGYLFKTSLRKNKTFSLKPFETIVEPPS